MINITAAKHVGHLNGSPLVTFEVDGVSQRGVFRVEYVNMTFADGFEPPFVGFVPAADSVNVEGN